MKRKAEMYIERETRRIIQLGRDLQPPYDAEDYAEILSQIEGTGSIRKLYNAVSKDALIHRLRIII